MKKLIYILILISILIYSADNIDKLIIIKENMKMEFSSSSESRIDGAKSVVLFTSLQKEWMDFQLPEQCSSFRIMSCGLLKNMRYKIDDPDIYYSIKYRLLSKGKKVLHESDYHFKTLPALEQKDNDFSEDKNIFIPGEELLLSRVRMAVIKFPSEIDRVEKIQIKASYSDDRIKNITMKIYVPRHLDDKKTMIAWKRMSRRQKNALASDHIYEAKLLNENEKRNSISFKWHSLAPEGVENQEYKKYRIYQLENSELSSVADSENVIPPGLYIPKGIKGSIPVPENSKLITLEMISLEKTDKNQGTSVFQWRGQTVNDRLDFSENWTGQTMEVTCKLGPGILYIDPAKESVVRVYSKDSNANLDDITPETLYSRYYHVNSDSDLEYSVVHSSDFNELPVRISIRNIFRTPGQVLKDTEINCAMIDKSGMTLENMIIKHSSVPSSFDRIVPGKAPETYDDHPLSSVCDGENYFLSVPDNISKLRFSSRSGLTLLNLSKRPPYLPRVHIIPEDRIQYGKNRSLNRSWFSADPENIDEILLAGEYTPLIIQPSPAEDDEDLIAGRYIWDQYRPEGKWLGRDLLEKVAARPPGKLKSDINYYTYFESDTPYSVDAVSLSGERYINTELIYSGKEEKAISIVIMLDGKEFYKGEFFGPRFKISLPPVNPGSHEISVSSSSKAELFINRLVFENSENQLYLKRSVNRVKEKRLEFIYSKETDDEEILSFRIYSSNNRPENENFKRHNIRVKLAPFSKNSKVLFKGWTIGERVYNIRKNNSSEVIVLDSQHETVSPEPNFYFPLHEDLPAGDYRIIFEDESDCLTYVALSRILKGKTERERFFRERSISQNDDDSKKKKFSPSDSLVEKKVFKVKRTMPDAGLKRLYRLSRHEGKYKDISMNEYKEVEKLFLYSLNGKRDDETLKRKWHSLGMEYSLRKYSGGDYCIIVESAEKRTGRGIFAFRKYSSSEILLQAPHSSDDIHTGRIVLKLFLENDIRAGAWNTVKRDDVDLSHTDKTYYQAFTSAFAKLNADSRIIQLHGFDEYKDNREDEVNTDIIISNGTRNPSSLIKDIAEAIRKKFELKVSVYPVDIKILGGTDNSQNKLLQKLFFPGFVHIEMTRELRKRLVKEEMYRKNLYNTFQKKFKK